MLDTSLDSTNFYFLLAVFQGLVLSILIAFQRPLSKPNVYLGILIFLFSLALLHNLLESSIHAFNVKFPVPMDFTLAYGPLAYLHILHIKDPVRRFGTKDLLHFVPTLIVDIIIFTSSFLYLGNNMEWAYENIPLIQTIAVYFASLDVAHLALYTFLIFRESQDTKLVLKDFHQVKKWLSLLVVSWSLVIGFMIIAIPISLIYIEELDDNSEWFYIPLAAIKSIWIFLLGYSFLLRYSKVVRSYMNRISKFQFGLNELDAKKDQLVKAFENDKLYTDPNVTVAKLAGHLNWPINSVSKVINEALHTNFSDLLNGYRVRAFQERAIQPDSQRYSILGIGQEVGFSSKASFYRIFKKETGMTPSEFLKSQG